MEKKQKRNRWTTDDQRNIRRIMAHLLMHGSMDDLPSERGAVSFALQKAADGLAAQVPQPPAPAGVKK